MTASPQDFPGLSNQPQMMMSPTLGGQAQGVVVLKPKSDVYTVMLVIAFLALTLGIICLVLEMDAYNWEYKGPPAGGGAPGAASWLAPSDGTPRGSAVALHSPVAELAFAERFVPTTG